MTASNTTAPANLTAFYQQFASRLRDPKQQQTNDQLNLPERVCSLYTGLIFNNMRTFLDACFPVCQSLITGNTWLKLCQIFWQYGNNHSPYFADIPEAFVQFLHTESQQETPTPDLAKLELPAYFADLAHYEWVELKVELSPISLALDKHPTLIKRTALTESAYIQLNPSLQNLHYQWAVHEISANNHPVQPQQTFLLVHRQQQISTSSVQIDHAKPHFKVTFTQINDTTHQLLTCIANHPSLNLTQLMPIFAAQIGYADVANLTYFASEILQKLHNDQIVFFTSKPLIHNPNIKLTNNI